MTTRIRLQRADGRLFLERWGRECEAFGVYLHRIEAPDPGLDLHDHPWWFASLVLRGGYVEERADIRAAPGIAVDAECHRITAVDGEVCWTLVLRGRRHRAWGFYLPSGFVDAQTYEATVRRERRDLVVDT